MENSIHSRFNDAIATIMGCLADEVDKILTDLLFYPLGLSCEVRDVDMLKIKRFISATQLNPLDGGMYLVIDDWGGIAPCLKIDAWLAIGRNAGMSSVETVYSPEAKAQPGMNPGVVGHDWIEVKVTFEPNAVVTHREFMAENFNAMSPAWAGRANGQLRWRAIAQAIRLKSGIQAGVEDVSSSSVSRAQQSVQIDEVKSKAEPQAEQQTEAKSKAEPQAEQQTEAKSEAEPQANKTVTVAQFNGSNHSLIIDQLLNGIPLPEASGREHIGKMRTALQRCYQSGEWEQIERYFRVGAPNASKAENDWRLQVFELFRDAVSSKPIAA